MTGTNEDTPMTRRPARRISVLQAITEGIPTSSRWGRVDVTPLQIAQQRSIRATLSIYPPGVTSRERTLMHLRKLGTTWVGLLGYLAVLVVAGIVLGVLGAAMAIAVLIALWAGIALATSGVNKDTRCLRIYARPGSVGGEMARLEEIATELDALDTANLDPVSYEAEWGRIYRQLA
ncbi:DUF6611 family protein [Rhodococcus opacus]|uniref:DUF6611 family protein n=2 Tax=Rhodococcus opacus TaxID=37919 RepID=UPI001BB05ACF